MRIANIFGNLHKLYKCNLEYLADPISVLITEIPMNQQ